MRGRLLLFCLLLPACATADRPADADRWWHEVVPLRRGFVARPGAEARRALGAYLDGLAPGLLRTREEGSASFGARDGGPSRTLRWRTVQEERMGGTDEALEVECAEEGPWAGNDAGSLVTSLRAWMAVNEVQVEDAGTSGIDLTWRTPLPEEAMDHVRRFMGDRGLELVRWHGEQEGGWEDYRGPGGGAEWFVWYSFACHDRVDPSTGETVHNDPVSRLVFHRPGTPFSIDEEEALLRDLLEGLLPEGNWWSSIRFVEGE